MGLMSIPMDLPPKEPVAIVMMIQCDVQTSANGYGLGFDYPTPRNVSPEKRAIEKQQEGEIRARVSWSRHSGESKGIARRDRPGRVERGHGAGVRAGLAFQRKRKALMAAMR